MRVELLDKSEYTEGCNGISLPNVYNQSVLSMNNIEIKCFSDNAIAVRILYFCRRILKRTDYGKNGFKTLTPVAVTLEQDLSGPADISVADGKIYIPDLPASRVVVLKE